MVKFVYVRVLFLFWCVQSLMSGVINRKQRNAICSEVPEMILEEVLGAAFNSRYMSIDKPVAESYDIDKSGKRKASNSLQEFYVDDYFYEQVDEQPAWDLKNHAKISKHVTISRSKREINYMQEWHCKSKIVWIDLGPDYFPRYLRSVECLSGSCWFNIYKCKPRSFTVKILKRKRDRCVVSEPGTIIGVSGLPRDLKEVWVWEERAVNFCCDCTM